ncbi:uncharacterized protein F54H12.2-like [Crassostrea angulata]|uniref:uncharacterized protein F54H12.2-like n=1 Tax=Magallana angulata TaxID=2784310 RepID=UPI0022B14F2A|nr:uncharacterized protein F54H12.2-like [Crassostrea angulata]
MAFLSGDNKDIAQPMELSLFSSPTNQVAVEKVYFTEARPISSIGVSDTPIEIVVSGSGAEYIDLKRSKLYVKARILKTDGTALADTEKTGIVNLPLQSMFSQMDVYLNNKLVSFNTNNYPWKAYLKTILFCGKDELDSQKQSELFYKDEGTMNDANAYNGANAGLVLRYGCTQKSKIFELEGNLKEDIFDIDKYLINGVDIYIKLFRSSTPFVIMSAEDSPAYKLELLDVVYKVAKVRVDPGVLLNHSKQIESTPVKYTISRNELKMNTIPKGSTEFYWDNIFPQAVPDRIVVALVDQKAGNGNYSANPFNFEHMGVTDVGIYVNGESVPGRPLKTDFSAGQYVAAYTRLFEASEKWNTDAGLDISRDNFGNGYSLFVFTIDPCGFGEDYLNLIRRGNTRLELKFKEATTKAANALVFATFSSLLEVDKSRDINYIQP